MNKLNLLSILLVVSSIISSCGNKSDARSEFLKCNKPFGERTEYEKIIGKWCGEKTQPGVGRRAVTRNMKFQSIICFYSDNTMKEFFRSESYMDSESEMDSGTNVQVNNDVLTYFSANHGQVSYDIYLSESSLEIDGKIDSYSKCN
jgi:hypothetical protein